MRQMGSYIPTQQKITELQQLGLVPKLGEMHDTDPVRQAEPVASRKH